jgi:hypothetical protein
MYSLRHRIESYLAFKICPKIKCHLVSQYELYLSLSSITILIFCVLSISLLYLIHISNIQTAILSRTEGVSSKLQACYSYSRLNTRPFVLLGPV